MDGSLIVDTRLNTQYANDIATRLQTVAHTLRYRRRLRLGVRAVWLALAVWCVGTIARLLGLPITPNLLLGLAGLTFLVAAAYAWFSQPSLVQLAYGLDDRYQLGQQLGTALELARRNDVNPLEDRLLQETDTLLVRIRRYFDSQPLVPWREIETFAALGLLGVGLWFGTGPQLPDALGPIALPTLPTPIAPTEVAQQQPTEQPISEEPPPPELSPEAQEAAAAIADALRDNGATRSAADALDQGDPSEAASELRELADQADQLSDQARQDLADSLNEAARQLSRSQPELSSELDQQANALRRGGEETAEALEDLARTVEQLAESGQQAAEGEDGQPGQSDQQGEGEGEQPSDQAGQPSGGAGAGNGLGGEQRGAQSGATEAQGDTLPLPESEDPSGPTTGATGPQGPSVQLEAGGTGSPQSSGGNSADQPLSGEADPLAIPSEYRDVVEDYFSPQP